MKQEGQDELEGGIISSDQTNRMALEGKGDKIIMIEPERLKVCLYWIVITVNLS